MTLSPREREVVVKVGRDGKSYQEVADDLGISLGTVRTYVGRIMNRYPRPGRPREALVALYYTVHSSADSGIAD